MCVSVCVGAVGCTEGHLLYRMMHLKPCRELDFGARMSMKTGDGPLTKDDPIARYSPQSSLKAVIVATCRWHRRGRAGWRRR